METSGVGSRDGSFLSISAIVLCVFSLDRNWHFSILIIPFELANILTLGWHKQKIKFSRNHNQREHFISYSLVPCALAYTHASIFA